MNPIVQLKNVTKIYETGGGRGVTALDDVSFEVYEGEIFGLVGPNGSGKTTTLKLLLGLVYPTAGEVKVFGKDPTDISVKSYIGFLPDGPYLYDYLNADEFLDFYAKLFGYSKKERKERIERLLEWVDMKRARKQPIRQYSKGMMQRVGLAQALINDPKLLLLDEPISGLDPLGIYEMTQMMKRLREEGRTVFLCSHMLWHVQALCDRVVILHEGRVVQQGKLSELIRATRFTEIVASGLNSDCIGKLLQIGVQHFERDGSHVFHVRPAEKAVEAIDIIKSFNGSLISITEREQTLEDIFVAAVQGGEAE